MTGSRAALVVGLLLLCGAALGDKDQEKPEDEKRRRQKDTLLEAKLKIIEGAQKKGIDTKDNVVESELVEEAPVARLWNADGDVSTAGEPAAAAATGAAVAVGRIRQAGRPC